MKKVNIYIIVSVIMVLLYIFVFIILANNIERYQWLDVALFYLFGIPTFYSPIVGLILTRKTLNNNLPPDNFLFINSGVVNIAQCLLGFSLWWTAWFANNGIGLSAFYLIVLAITIFQGYAFYKFIIEQRKLKL